MLAIIQHDFKQPVGKQGWIRDLPLSIAVGGLVAVLDAFQIALGKLTGDQPVVFLMRAAIDIFLILRLVLVKDGVAFVVMALTNQLLKYSGRICGIADTGIFTLAVDRSDIIFGDGSPMADAGCLICPAFYTGEQSFYAGR